MGQITYSVLFLPNIECLNLTHNGAVRLSDFQNQDIGRPRVTMDHTRVRIQEEFPVFLCNNESGM